MAPGHRQLTSDSHRSLLISDHSFTTMKILHVPLSFWEIP